MSKARLFKGKIPKWWGHWKPGRNTEDVTGSEAVGSMCLHAQRVIYMTRRLDLLKAAPMNRIRESD